MTWELLVVNNNCTDDTDGVIESFASTLPIRRLLRGAKPGQSNARNLAIREATGSYLVWTDDDTLVAPNWLESMAQRSRSGLRLPRVRRASRTLVPEHSAVLA